MGLTRASKSSPTDDGFPTTQLFILAICRVAEPIALTSIFPYSWLMVKGFQVGDPNDASFYAGLLISAFSLAESLTGMWWGALSDRVGRKPVLLLGCFGTMLSLLVVGFSKSFGMALFGRILGGVLNGNIGVIQTMVGELVTKPEHEPKAYSVMPFVWSIGTIIGPAVGGTLADPVKNFPSLFQEKSIFYEFPWLLPNLICALFMIISMVAGYLYLEETHPNLRKGADRTIHYDIAEQTPMISAGGANADPGVDMRQESYGTFNEVEVPHDDEWTVTASGSPLPQVLSEKQQSPRWFTQKVCMLVVALGIFAYHSMCYDHLLPIFLQDEKMDEIAAMSSFPLFHIPGGLGLTTTMVGMIMAVNGVIALIIQAVVFPLMAERLGVWRVFTIVTVLHPIAYFIVPYIALLPNHLVFAGIYVCLTIRNLFAILAYPVILILLKQASVSPTVLGRINGLAASVGAACRTVAPPVAGLLYGWGLDLNFTGLAWWGAGAVALIGTAQLSLVPREKESSVVRSLAPCFNHDSTIVDPNDVVKVTVVHTENCV